MTRVASIASRSGITGFSTFQPLWQELHRSRAGLVFLDSPHSNHYDKSYIDREPVWYYWILHIPTIMTRVTSIASRSGITGFSTFQPLWQELHRSRAGLVLLDSPHSNHYDKELHRSRAGLVLLDSPHSNHYDKSYIDREPVWYYWILHIPTIMTRVTSIARRCGNMVLSTIQPIIMSLRQAAWKDKLRATIQMSDAMDINVWIMCMNLHHNTHMKV